MVHSLSLGEGSLAGSASQTKHRVSVACLPCRSRHIRCNSGKPSCSRCLSDETPCIYTGSRRHGNRRQNADNVPEALDHRHEAMLNPQIHTFVCLANDHPVDISPRSSVTSKIRAASSLVQSSDPGDTGNNGHNILPIDEYLISLYYAYFHTAHPCVLPRWALEPHYGANPEKFKPIILVTQYIGSLFDLTINSETHREVAKGALPLPPYCTRPLSPHEIQAMLLYSVAVYWCDGINEGIDTLGVVTKGALELGMHLKRFATDYGCNDPVLEESWRRTWWQIYVTEGNIAGSTRKYNPFFLAWMCTISVVIYHISKQAS